MMTALVFWAVGLIIIDPMGILIRFNFFAIIVLSCPAIWIAFIIHLAHKQYRKNHPKPISKDAQITGLKSCIGDLQTEVEEYKDTVAALIRAFSLRNARKQLALAVVLGLFLCSVANPSLSLTPPAIGLESNEKPFFTAADGDVSSESIGEDYSHKLRETIPDDILFFPDAFLNDTRVVASSGDAGPTEEYVYTNTHSNPSIHYNGKPLADDYEMWLILNFTIPTGLQVEGLSVTTRYGATSLWAGGNYADNDNSNFSIYNWNTHTWDWQKKAFAATNENQTTISYDPDHWDTQVSIRHTCNGSVLGLNNYVTVTQADVMFYEMHLADSDHYADGFNDVSDWSEYSCEIAATLSTDDDVFSFETESSTDDNYNGYYSDIATFDARGKYIEFRARVNSTANYDLSIIRLVNSDDGGGSDYYGISVAFTLTTSWQTFKYPVDSFTKNGNGDLSAVESILILHRVDSAAGTKTQDDYLRIGPATEMGWQHDCSTTAGVDNTYESGGQSNFAFSQSSDGNVLTYSWNATSFGSTSGGYQWIVPDTTATVTDLERDYYPFIGLRYRITQINSATLTFRPQIDGYYSDFSLGSSTTGWLTLRRNLKAMSGVSANKQFAFFITADAQYDSCTLEIEWLKVFSIANWTYTGSGVGTDDYLYVDSGVLYSHIDDGYIELNHDPTLSVSDTYSVYNLTTSGTAPEFSQYVSSWSSYSDDTRGATTSGTVTDIKLKFDSTEIISAIKFIEDGTAPSVLRISATPPEPDDTENVTLSALATDTVEVYKVWFRPITDPTGYSPTDYEATEQTDNLWTYEFSSLDEGYWAFKAIAFDGVNNSTLDADSVIDFWVREKELIISNTLYTETSTQCSFAGQTNVACDYLIYDDDAEQESGNKAAGSFFLDWDKQTSVGTHDWGIKFYTASSTDWHNGSYEVLTTTLLVTEYGIRTTASYAYLNGYITLNANYTVYEETVQVGTGSVSAGSYEIRWSKASSSVENVTVLFDRTDGQTYPVYSGYDVAAQVTFVVESWWMDLNLGVESYVEFYVLSSFENATVYVYDNTTLMTTVTESAGGAYSYFWLSESEGLHTITLNITHGATVHTRTRTYYVPDWAATGLVMRWDLWTFQDNYTMLELESNWMNCTYYVYLNSSLVATSANDPVILNFTRAINIGTYNLTIFADGGTQTYSIKNIRYIITEEGVSYDYSSITGGRSVRYGDNYNYYTVTTEEPAPGILIDQTTAAIVSVGGFLIIFTAFLAARELRKREILKTERIFGK